MNPFLDTFLAANGQFFAEPGAGGRRPVAFALGISNASALSAVVNTGIPPGLALATLAKRTRGALRSALLGLAGSPLPVLLELDENPSLEARDLLADLADNLGSQLHLALPKGHDQAQTLDILMGLFLNLRRMADGIQVQLPIQGGRLAPDELQAEVQSLLGREVTPTFSTHAWKQDQVEAFVTATAPGRLHLQGDAPRDARIHAAHRLWELLPDLAITESRTLRGPLSPEHPDSGQFLAPRGTAAEKASLCALPS